MSNEETRMKPEPVTPEELRVAVFFYMLKHEMPPKNADIAALKVRTLLGEINRVVSVQGTEPPEGAPF